jgi:hypothetical protein
MRPPKNGTARRDKRPYSKPRVESQAVFETSLVTSQPGVCSKIPGSGDICNFGVPYGA